MAIFNIHTSSIKSATLRSKRRIRNPYYNFTYPVPPLDAPPYHRAIDKSNWAGELRHFQNGNVAIMTIRKLVVCIPQTTKINNVRRKYIFLNRKK